MTLNIDVKLPTKHSEMSGIIHDNRNSFELFTLESVSASILDAISYIRSPTDLSILYRCSTVFIVAMVRFL